MKPEPFRIEPEFVERIWGVRSLAPLFPEKTNLPEPIGEAWLSGLGCKIATGPYAGKTLGAAWREMPSEWRGRGSTDPHYFPILVKFIFPNEKLSIQVHPDDAYASVREKAAGGRGKTEMWHAVSAEAGANVLIGLTPEVDRERFVNAIETERLEEILVHWRVQTGDTFFVPAGTPHTIGAGMMVCEIQEYSDLTYRVYDYGRVDPRGRPRELHIQKALEVIDFGRPILGKVSPLALPSPGSPKELLAACRHFATERWNIEKRTEASANGEHFDLYVLLTGCGEFTWNGGCEGYRRGECWLIPAGSGGLVIDPKEPTKLLRSYVPDLQALRDCLRQTHPQPEIEKAVFD